MTELKAAMNTVKNHLGKNTDVVGFDACLMGMLEVYYQLNDTVDIAIGSEEYVPGDGWPYDDILTALKLNPEMSPLDISTEIVTDYLNSYGYDTDLTMAAYNISELSNALVPKVNVFSQKLKNNVYTYYPDIINARNETEFYSDYEYCDLYDFAYEIKHKIDDALIGIASQDVMDAINESCISEAHGIYSPDSHGLSIYWAENELLYNDDYENLDFAIDTQWDEFLNSYYTDAYESDNQYTQASWIESNGAKQLHNFHILGDHDWIKFNATANVSYVIETSEIGNDSDTYLYLYNIDGTTLIYSDDEGSASRINWTCPISGSYHLMVRHWDNLLYGPKTYYKLSVFIRLSANFTYEPLYPMTQDIVYFNSTTYDPYGNIINWTWTFGDGNISYNQSPTHQYMNKGDYTVCLNVTDDDGAYDSISKIITILDYNPSVVLEIYPLNNSINISRPIYEFNVTVSDLDGTNMSIYIRWINHTPIVDKWENLTEWIDVSNGTYSFYPSITNSWIWGNTTYTWSVNITDGTFWTNKTFTFATGGSRYDVNNNDIVNFQDAGLVWIHRTSKVDYDGIYDVNQNGVVNFQDAGLTWVNRD